MYINRKRTLYAACALLLLVSQACSIPGIAAGKIVETPQANTQETPQAAAPTVAETAVPNEPSPTPPSGVFPAAFASYPDIPVKYPAKPAPDYTLPIDISGINGLADLKLTDAQKALLTKNGFVVAEPVPGKFREFYQLYESNRYDQVPIFISTDAIFHIYHLIFDKMLRDLETEHFITMIGEITRAMVTSTAQQLAAVKGTNLEEPARRNLAYFSVASQLLGLDTPVPAEVSDLVNQELALINAHSGAAISPIWDRSDLPADKKLIEDYGQYVPRGHYTRSEALKQYFKAMMWYGRMSFRLRDAFETRRALLLTQAMRTTQTSDGTLVAQVWQNIYDPTVFIVGKADDLSYHEYGVLSDSVFGADAPAQAFEDDAKLAQFTSAARQLPAPQVNSMWVWIWEDKKEATQAFRFMGQRFTLDEYVFGQMIYRNVGTDTDPRMLPKGMDFMASLGSDEALSILNTMGETQYANYSDQMTKVRKEVAGLQKDSWTQNLYWSWLYTFLPMIEKKDSRFPVFMQTEAWMRKELNTALGSWTELKHDTILYAKQVMAEMGGGGPDQAPPHGYVEPNPEVYARLLALSKMTEDGLRSRNLLTALTEGNLSNLSEQLTMLQSVSERELAGEQLSNDEYWALQYFGGVLENLTLAAADASDPSMRDLNDQKAALVADVATGADKGGGLVALEEAIGQPTLIYVIPPDQPRRIAVGGVFSYYEFTVSSGERMTDEQWQAKVESGDLPKAPDWTSQFVAP